MQKYFLAACAAMLILSCSGNKEDQKTEEHTHHGHEETTPGNEQTRAMMAIHDSIMPAMETVMNLKSRLTAELKSADSLLAIKATEAVKKRKDEALVLHEELEKADKDMMDWMHNYRADSLAQMDEKSASAYISEQKTKIEIVRDKMKKSIADAKQFFEKK